MNIFEYWPELADGIRYTLQITFSAFAIAIVLGIPLTVMRLSRFKALRAIAIAYVELIRGLPPLTWLFLVFFGLPALGLMLRPIAAGTLVIGVIYSSYMVDVYRSGLRAVPTGQREAALATGLSPVTTYRKVLIPQAFRTILPSCISYLIALLKDSSIVSVIGVLDITALALTMGQGNPESLTIFVSAAAMYLVISAPIGIAARSWGDRLRHDKVRVS